MTEFYDPIKIEERMLKLWKDQKFEEKLSKLRAKSPKRFSFIDGPPTANNPMGVHHAWGRTYKDLYLRFNSMQGFQERKQPGFDCQGLWVEVGVEKELGFKSKRDIESYGIQKFTEKCKETVLKFVKVWIELSQKLGMWMDWDNPYLTMTDKNIEYVWFFLKKCWEKGWLYKGLKSLPWCPRCSTSLSQQEVAISYKEVTHPSVYLKFKISDKSNTYFLVWTTTPWTLPSNVALAVHPDFEYVEVSHQGENLILLKSLMEKVIGKKEKIIKTIRGKDLQDIKYDSILPELPLQKFEHMVVLYEQVSADEGTGIIHIAPGHGPEDFEIGQKYKLPILSPINDQAIYDKSAGILEGKYVKDANQEIIKILQHKNLVFKSEQITHSYPTCWRCGTELVYKTGEEWFIRTNEIKPKLIAEARKVYWYPEWNKKSMLDWLENLRDWNISRKRYYGMPLPFWKDEKGHLEIIGSLRELRDKAVKGMDQLKELHRPWIDNVTLKCNECGREMKRVTEIGDVWLDAAVVPFSTQQYLENKEYWKHWFPADLVTEMHEQVKLWFYAMLFVGVTLENKSPYRSVLAHAMVLDEKGREMHKSTGNVIWGDEGLNKIGADVMRWMYCLQNPGIALPFGYTPATEIKKSLNILFNTAEYVKTYCEANNYKPGRDLPLDLASRWIFSKLETLKKNVTKYLNELKPNLAAREIQNFFLDDFSRNYIHIIRPKVKPGINNPNKGGILFTLYKVMFDLTSLVAPFLPFLSEEIYQKFYSKFEKLESIHFHKWPEVDSRLINQELENKMEIVKKIIEASYAARQKAQLKLRWPVRQILVKSSNPEVPSAISALQEILVEMCNAKSISILGKEKGDLVQVEFDLGSLYLDKKLDEELLNESMIRELIREIQNFRKRSGLEVKEKISLFLHSDENTNKILINHKKEISEEVGASQINIGQHAGKFKGEIKFKEKHISFSFSE